jgi:hypothetical protein
MKKKYKINRRICKHCKKEFQPTGCKQYYCPKCIKFRKLEAMKRWRKLHREEERIKALKYYYEHREECNKNSLEYYNNNKEKCNANTKRHQKLHHDRTLYAWIKKGCKKRKIKLEITIDEFCKWYNKIPKICIYCGISEQEWLLSKDSMSHWYKRLQIDRKNNKLGYFLENLAISCARCNRTKTDFFTFEQMKIIGEIVHANC